MSKFTTALVLCLSLLSCTGGTLDSRPPDGDVPDSSVRRDGGDGGDGDSGEGLCGPVLCGSGQSCVDGRCVTDDCCAHIVCSNEGDVCRGCECVAGAADDDGDGFAASEDCDDADPDVAPGTTRPCYSGCGAPGLEICVAGAWVDCNAPPQCDCTPDEQETVDCGMCGAASRTCLESGTWGPTGTCTGEGECMAASSQSRGCGSCGTETRTCTSDCAWSGWGLCAGEGECAPASSDSRWCGQCGSQSRSCSDICAWGAWGSCTESGTDRTAWSRVNDSGVDTMSCAAGFVVGVGTRELDSDWHLDEMALECCGLVQSAAGACSWTTSLSIALEGNAQFLCPAGTAMTAIETEEWGEDLIVDNLRTQCCPTTAGTTSCAWQPWVGVSPEGEYWMTCPAGTVAVSLESNEFGGDWLVDSMRLQCCS